MVTLQQLVVDYGRWVERPVRVNPANVTHVVPCEPDTGYRCRVHFTGTEASLFVRGRLDDIERELGLRS